MDTITLYHGGSSDFKYNYKDMVANKSGRWEFGVGIYLTNEYKTASRYSGGSRTIFKVTIRTDGHDISKVNIDKDVMVAFLRKYVSKAKVESEYIPYIDRRDTCSLMTLTNLCVNNKFPSSKTVELREFIIANGGDYSIERGLDGYVVVVINPKLIVNVEQSPITDYEPVDVSKLL